MTAHNDEDDVAYYLPTEAKKMRFDEQAILPSAQYEIDIAVKCACPVVVSSSTDDVIRHEDVKVERRTSCDITSDEEPSCTLMLDEISSSDKNSISRVVHINAGNKCSVAKIEIENELLVAKDDSGFEASLTYSDNNTLPPSTTFQRTLLKCNASRNHDTDHSTEANNVVEVSSGTDSVISSEANMKPESKNNDEEGLLCVAPHPTATTKNENDEAIIDIQNTTEHSLVALPDYLETSCENDSLLPAILHYTITTNIEDDVLSKSTLRSFSQSTESISEHCRVCHSRGDEELISPCHCNGSLKYVHESCLITWMKNPFKDSCEICRKKILIVKKRKPFYKWRWPLQRPTPLVWVMVFTIAICVNLMSVVKDATRKCVTTSCIIFYVIGSVGIILASMFLYFWVKRVKVFCETWKVQNEHWVVKIEDDVTV